MKPPADKPNKKGGGTLLTALLLSAPGPLVTGISAIMGRSVTQLADFIRRTAELVATFVSWWVFHRLEKHPEYEKEERCRLERLANRAVSLAMLLSGAILFIVGVISLFQYTPSSGNVVMGFVIAVLGLITNSIFWLRYRKLARQEGDSVIQGQQALYRAKALVDCCVVAVLAFVLAAPNHSAVQYLDAGGSMAVALYLLYSGLRTRKAPSSVGSQEGQ